MPLLLYKFTTLKLQKFHEGIFYNNLLLDLGNAISIYISKPKQDKDLL